MRGNRFLVKPVRRGIVRKHSPRAVDPRRLIRRKTNVSLPLNRSGTARRGPDIIDHLKGSERLMTARELASILAISPKMRIPAM